MDRMKGIYRCADCVYYSLQRHKCNICNSVESNPADSFFDDCPHPDAVPTRQQEWIPVSERLPEDKENVLTYKNGIMEIQEYEKGRKGWVCGGWFWSAATVTHWMPLPEPPTEEGD